MFELPKPISRIPKASGGVTMNLVSVPTPSPAINTLQNAKKADNFKPSILFEGVVCTEESYEIDIFLKGVKSQAPDPVNDPDFVSRLFRLGMCKPPLVTELKNMSRYLKESVTRVIDAGAAAGKINETGWFQTVKELDGSEGGRMMDEYEWKGNSGFEGKLVWVAK